MHSLRRGVTFRIFFLVNIFAFPVLFSSQIPTVPIQGLRDNTPRIHALIGATIVAAPGKVLENAAVVIRNGIIENVGIGIELPPDARVWDMSGKTIYAGFIDSFTHLGLPPEVLPKEKKVDDEKEKEEPAEPAPTGGPQSWNKGVTPQREAAGLLDLPPDEADKLRNLGFGAALIVPGRGTFRGQSALVNLTGLSPNTAILTPNTAQHVGFELIKRSDQQYPTSLMGSIALIRQTLLDALWYKEVHRLYTANPEGLERPETNEALAALASAVTAEQLVIFEAGDELDFLRCARIADEFGLRFSFYGNGYEYRRASLLKEIGTTVIVPLNFPEPPPVETPELALDVSLEALQHWEFAPSNAAFLANAGVPFCFTTKDLDKPNKNFWKHVRKTVERGLSHADALAALTTRPAALLGVEERLGTIEPGKIANIVVADGNLFADKNARILTVWVDGRYYETNEGKKIDPRGSWTLQWQGVTGFEKWEISGKPDDLNAKTGEEEFSAKVQDDQVLLFPPASLFGHESGSVRLAGYLHEDTLRGTGQMPDGIRFGWSALRVSPFLPEEEEDKSLDESPPPLVFDSYPAGAYGRKYKPEQHSVILVKNATIWTCGPDGNLLKADLLVENGKISKIGVALKTPPDALVINANGKHLTPGLIDCHSHTGISRGVNEASHAVTLEVRIGDVIDPTDIGFYRELAGGLTIANILHGSANPMGGQNQVVKLRWGEDAEGLKFKKAMPGVKFALGENVKQSNRGSKFTTRYPQTRMGVEQIMRDTFQAAKEYDRTSQRYRKGEIRLPPRRNLRLEAALEILRNERMVHIHSYRQDEILMFIRLAEELGIKTVTFQHILEGYKVADEMARIGAGGSTFSDWWAYKFEVYDAIPYNGALMHRAGVVATFNSDSNEMARRLNTEAAKAVKYGGLSEEEAFNFVTINAARQLQIDKWVGSLEQGKDADFVIWSGPPLSTYTYAEQTWIDGRKYFDREEDRQQQKEAAMAREKLINKALPARLKILDAEAEKKVAGPPQENPPEERSNLYRDYRSIYHNGSSPETCTDTGYLNF